MNGYEDDQGRVVLLVIRHDKMFSNDMRGPSDGIPTFDRWIIDPKKTKVKEERLDDSPQEFPRINDLLIGKPFHYGYTADLPEFNMIGGLRKHDVHNGTSETFGQGDNRVFFEPVFVPRSAGAGEDDGWVLSYVYDRRENRSDVVIIDALNFCAGPVATVHLPQRVPYGFHGNWVSSPP